MINLAQRIAQQKDLESINNWPKGCKTFKDYVQFCMLEKKDRERVCKERGIEEDGDGQGQVDGCEQGLVDGVDKD